MSCIQRRSKKMRMRNFTIGHPGGIFINVHDVNDALAASTAVSNSRTRFVGCREIMAIILQMACNAALLQCSVDNLPSPFESTADRDRPGRDRFQAIVPANEFQAIVPANEFQAIVPANEFQCSGRVTEWGACVHPGGMSSEEYYIQFQVWRPTGPSGCYSLVGFNRPVDGDGEDGVLRPQGDFNDPLRHCVVATVSDRSR